MSDRDDREARHRRALVHRRRYWIRRDRLLVQRSSSCESAQHAQPESACSATVYNVVMTTPLSIRFTPSLLARLRQRDVP